jgi:hypothetical protein
VAGLVALVALYGSILLRLVRGTGRARAPLGVPGNAARAPGRFPAEQSDEGNLGRAALWSFGIACAITFLEWPFAHGIAQLIMLVAAMGLALDRQHLLAFPVAGVPARGPGMAHREPEARSS